MSSFCNRPLRENLADTGYWSLDSGCRRAGHCARRHAQSFAVGTARGASACAARERTYDLRTANPVFIQYLASKNQHRSASSNGTLTSPNRRFEAELRWMLIVGGLRVCEKKDSAPTFMQKIQNVSHIQGLGAGLSDTRNCYCVHFS